MIREEEFLYAHRITHVSRVGGAEFRRSRDQELRVQEEQRSGAQEERSSGGAAVRSLSPDFLIFLSFPCLSFFLYARLPLCLPYSYAHTYGFLF